MPAPKPEDEWPMRMYFSHCSIFAALMPLLAAGCSPLAQPPAGNPIADELVSQAHELCTLARACRDDAAAYREHPQAATAQACGREGIVQVSWHQPAAVRCTALMIGQIPSCQRWDRAYRAIITANEGDTARAHDEVEQMETEELMRSH
jgi:outer membrane murein-binding lipoprotein Lpp